MGVRSGLTRAEFAERYPREHAAWLVHDETLLVDGEESSAQVRARVLPALVDCLEPLAPGRDRVVVTPRRLPQGRPGRPARLAARGLPTLRGMDNCGWAVLGEHDGQRRLRLVSYNETAAVGPHPEHASRGRFRCGRRRWLRFRELPTLSGRQIGAVAQLVAHLHGMQGVGVRVPLQLHQSFPATSRRPSFLLHGALRSW